MSKISTDTVVRELQKTIVTLINKVESLEVLINEQSVLIAKLSPIGEKSCTRKSTNPTPAAAVPLSVPATIVQPSQRPIRSARANASLAITELSKPINKRGNVRATATGSPKGNAQPDNLVKALTPKPSTNDNDIKSLPPTPDVGTSNLHEEKSDDSTPWHTVGRKIRKKIQRPVTVGTGCETDNLKAADRMKYIQAWSFHPNTTPEQVRDFLNNIIGSEYIVDKRNVRTTTHACFVIGMPEGVYEKVTTPSAWPPRVCFADWFPVRPRLQRGSERT